MDADKILAVPAGGAVSGIDGAGGSNLAALSEGHEARSFSRMVGSAVEHAVRRPTYESPAQTERLQLSAATTGPVGSEKMDVISDVARPGATAKPAETQDVQQQTEDRMRALYVDLTNYQIAWKIAQRVQQDTSQLLRGN